MAKIPDATLQERPSLALGGGGFAQYRPDFGGGEAVGRQLMQTGGELQQAGDRTFVMAKQEQEKIDNLKAEDAWSKLRMRQLDLTYGEKEGYDRLKGAAAVNTPVLKDWTAKFQADIAGLEAGLTTEEQRIKFRQRASISSAQFAEGILRHTARESDVYAKEVYDGTKAVEVRQATANWQSPAEVALSIERATAAVKEQADRNGWAPALAEAERLKVIGSIHSAVVGQALASGNFEYAQKWYEQYKADVDLPTAKALETAVRDGTQRQLTAGYSTAIIENRDNPAALRQIEKLIVDDKRLDDTRRAALQGSVTSKIDQVERRIDAQAERELRRMEINQRRAERAQDRWERQVERNIDQIIARLPFGEPSMEALTPLIDATKGTPKEAEVRQLVNTANATRSFRLAPAVQQENYLAQVRALARTDPGKVDAKMIPILENIYSEQRKAIKDNPYSFVVNQGLVDMSTPGAQPIDVSNPASQAAMVAIPQRLRLSAEAARYTNGEWKPFTQAEAELAVKSLATMGPEQKRGYFASMFVAAEKNVAGYNAIMAQLAPDNPVLATAGISAVRQNDNGQGRRLSDLLIKGEAILNPPRKTDGKPDTGKLLPAPPVAKLRLDFDNYVRDALGGNPKARSDYFQSTMAVYMALSSEAGDPDTSNLNDSRWQEAMKLTMGNIESWNGRNTLLPWGLDNGQFKDGLSARINSLIESGRLDPNMTYRKMWNMQLLPDGRGGYALKAGDATLRDKAGNEVIIDFSRPPVWTPPKVTENRTPTKAELEEASRPYTGTPRRKQDKK